jgi:hypothetical protein
MFKSPEEKLKNAEPFGAQGPSIGFLHPWSGQASIPYNSFSRMDFRPFSQPTHQFAAPPPVCALWLSVSRSRRCPVFSQAIELIVLSPPGTDPAGRPGEESSCLSFHLSVVIAAPAAGC